MSLLEPINGHLQGTISGRQWRGAIPRGTRSRQIYRAVQSGLSSAGLFRSAATNQERHDAASAWFASDEAWAVAMETIRGWTISEGGLASVVSDEAFDDLFGGHRVTEVVAVASSAWEVLGYLLPPGALAAPGAKTPSKTE